MLQALSTLLLGLRSLSAGIVVILVLLAVSGVALTWSRPQYSPQLEMWMFSPEHRAMYEPVLKALAEDGNIAPDISLMSPGALKGRMMSGFFGGLATADLIEVERAGVGAAFMGPVDAIGFRDLTDQLTDLGLLDAFNPPSLSPWSVNGRVFGLPHDVHPVMLAYRGDLVEAAGIDLEQATTWDAFFELLQPMMADENNDGQPDRYIMSLWVTQQDNLELLVMQGGGRLFADDGTPTMAMDRNARLLAHIVSWCAGSDRVVTDIDEFSAAGHQARVNGDAIAYLCPDWMCSVWKLSVPAIGGKMKLMPLPAFEPGGRRTSVRGGTMLGFPKTSTKPDLAWEVGMLLYTSPEAARALYREVDIITPFRTLWQDPIYDEPDPFFMGQKKGRMYIELAPDVPVRTSSPYNQIAVFELRDAAVNLLNWANERKVTDPAEMFNQAMVLLQRAQTNVVRQMSRNAFTEKE